ncbi:hypothetical protein CLU79DRAFT_824347 [Phycomyces nitens]|nr:hypothetical protein CLU79DRAFT_824347 [Phycomyces nitens]
MKEGRKNTSLKSISGAFDFCLAALKQDQVGFCKWVWNHEPEVKEKEFIEMMKYILTDFHLNCKTSKGSVNDERTPFVETVVSLLKAFAKNMDTLGFVWCEHMLSSRKFVSFGAIKVKAKKADGIGRATDTEYEMLLVEASGSNLSENVTHSMNDTLEQIESTTASLEQQINIYKSASFETLKKRKSLGIQIIQNTLTLTETSIISPKKWRFVELRSAVIPTSWSSRAQLVKVFELVATLHILVREQMEITEQLEAKVDGIEEVDKKDGVEFHLSN